MAEMLACTERHRAGVRSSAPHPQSIALRTAIVGAKTGQSINDRAMAEAVGLDPERPAKLARLACVPQEGDDDSSNSTDDEATVEGSDSRKGW